MLVVGIPLLGVKVGVAVVSSVPNTVLKRVGRHLVRRFRKIVLALVVVELNRAESDVIA